MSAYRRDFDETKYMSILIKGDELQKNIMEVGKQLKIVSKKNKLDYGPAYNEKYLKTKKIS